MERRGRAIYKKSGAAIASALLALSSTPVGATPKTVDARELMGPGTDAPEFFEHKYIIVKLSARYDEVQYVFSYHYLASQLYVLFLNATPEQMDKKSASFLKRSCGEVSSDTQPQCQVRVQFKLTSCAFERGPMLFKDIKTPADAAKASAITTCAGEGFKVLR